MATVIKRFVDADTMKLYEAGMAYDGTREKELSALGYIDSVAEAPKRKKKESKDDNCRED